MHTDMNLARADRIYRAGPETLAAQSSAIVAGPVAHYVQRDLVLSQPGPDGFPLRWTVTGQIDRPQSLKGRVLQGPIELSRREASPLLPAEQPDVLYWEVHYGALIANEPAVLFMEDGNPPTILKVVPSGAGEMDLIGLIRVVAAIQAIPSTTDRTQRWLAYLSASSTDEGRKATLRSLIAAPVAWTDFEPLLGPFLRNAKLSAAVRAFGFGIVAFAVAEEKWGPAFRAATAFLCRVFGAEREPRLATQFLYALGQLLTYAAQEDFRLQRAPVRDLVLACLQERPTLGGGLPIRPDLEQNYQETLAQYLGR